MDYFEEDGNRIIYKYKDTCFYKVKIDDMDASNSSFLEEIVKSILVDDSIKTIVIDLENVKYLDSTSVGIFIHVQKTAVDKEKNAKMVNIRPSIKTMICVIGLDEYFNIDEDYFKFPIYSIEDRK